MYCLSVAGITISFAVRFELVDIQAHMMKVIVCQIVSHDWNEIDSLPVDIAFWMRKAHKFPTVMTIVNYLVIFQISNNTKLTCADPTELGFFWSFRCCIPDVPIALLLLIKFLNNLFSSTNFSMQSSERSSCTNMGLGLPCSIPSRQKPLG